MLRQEAFGRYTLLSLSIAAALGAAPNGSAQEAGLDEITITGTRIRRSDYTSPTPTTTIDGDYLRDLGLVSVGEALTQNPTNVSRFQASTTGSGSFFVGTTMANLRGLNPYFGTRTLTLVDSMRHVPTNQGGSVDLNFVPSVIIERMETVTGGASASYGSDAVTGVVNILLDKEFTGLKLETDYGASGQGDADNRGFGLAFGTDLFENRGHFVLGYEFQDQNSIDNCVTARDWCNQGRSIFVNSTTAISTTNTPGTFVPIIAGQPHSLIVDNQRSGTTPNGLLWDPRAGATRYQFNDAGTGLVPYNAGQYAQVQAARNVLGGDGRSTFDGQTLMPDVDRNILYTHFDLDINDKLQFTTDFSWGKVNTANLQSGPSNVALCIRPDNAYLPSLDAASRALVLGAINQATGSPNPCTAPRPGTTTTFPWSTAAQSAVITKDFSTQQSQRIRTEAEVFRAVAGLTGAIGDTETWTWDTYVQFGHATRDQIGDDYRTQYRFALATDTVINPLTGQPDCRVNVASIAQQVYPIPGMDPFLAQGCTPINPFGQTLSAAAHDYAFDPLEEFNTIDQQVYSGSVSGDLWKGWGAGALIGAAGLEHRIEELDNLTSKTRVQAYRDDMSLTFGNDFAGETKISEAFVEVEMPLLADKPGARLWNINTAARRTRYDNTETRYSNGAVNGQHDVTSWKVSTTYDPVDWVRIRASRSRDIRAAGFRELYYQQSIQSGAPNGRVINPYTRVANDEALILLTGAPDLRPETANTNTFGVVFSPQEWAQGLQFSVDYYEIKLKDGVQRGSSQLVADNCAVATGPGASAEVRAALCPLMIFGPDLTPAPGQPVVLGSNVDYIQAPYFNDLPYEAAGVDFAGNYTFDIGSARSLSIRLMASHALKQQVVIGTNRLERDIAGQTGNEGFLPDYTSAAEWSVNLLAGYTSGPLSITTQARYTSSGTLDQVSPRRDPSDPLYDPTRVNSIVDNSVPSYVTQNVTASYDFMVRDTQAEVWMSVNNLWDKTPPFSAGGTGGVNGIFYDTLGRSYRMGIRLNF